MNGKALKATANIAFEWWKDCFRTPVVVGVHVFAYVLFPGFLFEFFFSQHHFSWFGIWMCFIEYAMLSKIGNHIETIKYMLMCRRHRYLRSTDNPEHKYSKGRNVAKISLWIVCAFLASLTKTNISWMRLVFTFVWKTRHKHNWSHCPTVSTDTRCPF